MVIAFRAYLRVGEMVPRSRNMVQGCLHVEDVMLTGDLINVSFCRFKHGTQQGPQSLQVRLYQLRNYFCQITLLRAS